ncbi:MAG: ribonuclease HII [Thermoplasmata archaeon]|nr:ribonuclease HII [Thermoplasmata archaeon]
MICGIDEAGRGPVIGPMVVAGVWANEGEEKNLIQVGIKDSKKVSRLKRERLAEYIRKNFYYEMIIVKAEDIDTLRQEMTLNELEANVFAKIANKKMANVYYLDAASANENEFKKMVEARIKFDCNIICEHEADDRYAIVSAASIIAKVERDRQLKGIAKILESKLNAPVGSGYPSDKRTINFIKSWLKKYGELPPHTRHSWRTIQNIKNEMKQKKLKDY